MDGRLQKREGGTDGLVLMEAGRCKIVVGRLTLRWMLETAVGNSAQKLGLEQEVAETSRVDADVGALFVDIVASGGGSLAALLAVGGGGLISGQLLIRVIDQILFGRHGEQVLGLVSG